MLGLFTKARLTQRSLFKSIYNILKVIFSLNKRLRDMTLFSLLVFQTEKHPILQIRPQAETSLLKLLLVGLWRWGGECSPGKVTEDVNNQCQEGWEWSDARIRGHKQVASISSPSVT